MWLILARSLFLLGGKLLPHGLVSTVRPLGLVGLMSGCRTLTLETVEILCASCKSDGALLYVRKPTQWLLLYFHFVTSFVLRGDFQRYPATCRQSVTLGRDRCPPNIAGYLLLFKHVLCLFKHDRDRNTI